MIIYERGMQEMVLGEKNIYPTSTGIELDNNGTEFSELQINSLLRLFDKAKERL
jgi:N-acetyl-anhydromuramyl-L-alanine amidase AmpD